MVLSLKAWKSRSLPGLPRTNSPLFTMTTQSRRPPEMAAVLFSELPSGNRKPPRSSPRRLFLLRAIAFPSASLTTAGDKLAQYLRRRGVSSRSSPAPRRSLRRNSGQPERPGAHRRYMPHSGNDTATEATVIVCDTPLMGVMCRGFRTGSQKAGLFALPIRLCRCYIALETRGLSPALRILTRGGAAR